MSTFEGVGQMFAYFKNYIGLCVPPQILLLDLHGEAMVNWTLI